MVFLISFNLLNFTKECSNRVFPPILMNGFGIFEPNLFVEIDDVIDKKIDAFLKYDSQVRPGGRDADSIRNQAKYRGQEVGKNLCEAFYAHRFIL